MGISIAGQSHAGAVRGCNQDVVAWFSGADGNSALALVADGMGGYQGGEVASRIAADTLTESLAARLTGPYQDIPAQLKAGFALANTRIAELRDAEPQLEKMGTTLVVVWLEGQQAHIAHVGDSRCYLVRNDKINCLTRDDTVVRKMLDDGSITEADVPNVPFRNMLTRAVGAMDPVELTYSCQTLEYGDRLLLCSDGLTNSVAEEDWHGILQDRRNDAVVEALIGAALENRASDNVSVVLMTLDM